jgi:hypothetical protein
MPRSALKRRKMFRCCWRDRGGSVLKSAPSVRGETIPVAETSVSCFGAPVSTSTTPFAESATTLEPRHRWRDLIGELAKSARAALLARSAGAGNWRRLQCDAPPFASEDSLRSTVHLSDWYHEFRQTKRHAKREGSCRRQASCGYQRSQAARPGTAVRDDDLFFGHTETARCKGST